jgi:hypothetical protein
MPPPWRLINIAVNTLLACGKVARRSPERPKSGHTLFAGLWGYDGAFAQRFRATIRQGGALAIEGANLEAIEGREACRFPAKLTHGKLEVESGSGPGWPGKVGIGSSPSSENCWRARCHILAPRHARTEPTFRVPPGSTRRYSTPPADWDASASGRSNKSGAQGAHREVVAFPVDARPVLTAAHPPKAQPSIRRVLASRIAMWAAPSFALYTLPSQPPADGFMSRSTFTPITSRVPQFRKARKSRVFPAAMCVEHLCTR